MIEIIGSGILLGDGCEIKEYYTEKGRFRAFISNGCIQSLLCIDDDALLFDYFNFFDFPVKMNPDGENFLMLGGGCMSYPHYYLNTYRNKKMDVVEINKKNIEYASKYFYLDKLLEQSKRRLNIIVDDALDYISYCKKKYDYILVDLFDGRFPITKVYEKNNKSNLFNLLSDKGIIIINFIIFESTDIKELKKIIENINYYKIIANNKYFDNINNIGNIIIFLSNNDIDIPDTFDFLDVSYLVK